MNIEDYLKDWLESIPSGTYPEGILIEPLKYEDTLELKNTRKKRKIVNADYVRKNEFSSLFWFAKQIKMDFIFLVNVLGSLRRRQVHYCLHHRKKRCGGFRIIQEPIPKLKKVQKRIARFLKEDLWISDRAFGFSGGGVENALRPHLKSGVFMTFDIKNAFPSITSRHIRSFLKLKGFYYNVYLKQFSSEQFERGIYSTSVINFILDFCTLEDRLPQGAPSSPILFDLVFSLLDEVIKNYTELNGLIYTRYADNIFISARKEIIPKQKWNVLKIVMGKKYSPKLDWHKLRIDKMNKVIHGLGLNIIDRKLHNTRQYKRRLRLWVHHIKWLKSHGRDYDNEYERLMGMMGFAIKETLNPNLLKEILYIKENF